MIKIVPPQSAGSEPVTGTGTRILAKRENGSYEEIHGVVSVHIVIEPDSYIQAELTVSASMDEVWAEPFMSEQSFLDAARRYGYSVHKEK